jgi:D-alanine-D-alanine ligase
MIEAAPLSQAPDIERERLGLWDFQCERRGGRVAVAAGVCSREDSVRVGRFGEHPSFAPLVEALERLEFEVMAIDPSDPVALDDLTPADLVFVHMHGEFGEDGRLQGLLDYRGLHYTGSGVLASALGLDKVIFKRVLRGCGLPTPDYYALDPNGPLEAQLDDAVAALPGPWIVKPISGGSSIATELTHDLLELRRALEIGSRDRCHPVFIEQFVKGSMVTVGMLHLPSGLTAFPVVRPSVPGEFLDLETKLSSARDLEGRGLEIPADLDEGLGLAIRATALEVHQLVGCAGFSRVDMVVEDDGTFQILEINTIPGISPGSKFVTGGIALGLSYDELLLAILRASVALPASNSPPARTPSLETS